MIHEGDILAIWDVGGATFLALQDDAVADARNLMEGIPEDEYTVFVYGATPAKQTGPEIEMWKGKAVVTWSHTSSQLSANVEDTQPQIPGDSLSQES